MDLISKIILLLFSLGIFTGYVIGITINFGWLGSISSSYYQLKRKYLFYFFSVLLSIPLLLVGDSVFFTIAAAGICFSGAANSMSHLKSTEVIHVMGADTGILFGMLGLWVSYGLWYFVIIQIIFTILTMWFKMKNHTFWIEILAYYLIWIGLLMNI